MGVKIALWVRHRHAAVTRVAEEIRVAESTAAVVHGPSLPPVNLLPLLRVRPRREMACSARVLAVALSTPSEIAHSLSPVEVQPLLDMVGGLVAGRACPCEPVTCETRGDEQSSEKSGAQHDRAKRPPTPA